MTKRILLLIAPLLVVLATTAFAADGSWSRVKAAGKLVIGLDDAFPPMGYRDAGGKLVGFDIDAATEVGKRLGIGIEWQPTPWDGVIAALKAKKIDAIWNGMSITPARTREVAFSKPYLMDGQVALVKLSDKRFRTLADLKGVNVGVQKGSSALAAVKKLTAQPAELHEYVDNPAALADLEAGRLDTVVMDNVAGRSFLAKRLGRFKILPGFLSKEPFGVAFRKEDRELREKVQQALAAMMRDGTMGQISRTWFGEDITFPKK